MIVVIFEVTIEDIKADRYFEIAATLREELKDADGFISIERFRSLSPDAAVGEQKYLSLSYWRDQDAVDGWYANDKHKGAQNEGRGSIFKDYRIRVAEVFREYDLAAGRPD